MTYVLWPKRLFNSNTGAGRKARFEPSWLNAFITHILRASSWRLEVDIATPCSKV
jgi:hypothetical protein